MDSEYMFELFSLDMQLATAYYNAAYDVHEKLKNNSVNEVYANLLVKSVLLQDIQYFYNLENYTSETYSSEVLKTLKVDRNICNFVHNINLVRKFINLNSYKESLENDMYKTIIHITDDRIKESIIDNYIPDKYRFTVMIYSILNLK